MYACGSKKISNGLAQHPSEDKRIQILLMFYNVEPDITYKV